MSSYPLNNIPADKWAALKIKAAANQTTIRQILLDAIDAYIDAPPVPPPFPVSNSPWTPTTNHAEEKVQIVAYLWQSIRDYLKSQPGSYGDAITRAVLQDQARLAAAAPPVVDLALDHGYGDLGEEYLLKDECTLTDTNMCPKTGRACPFFDSTNYFCKYS